MRSNSWGETQQRWVSSGFPFTIGILVVLGVTAFLPLISPEFYGQLMFVAPQSLARPWTLLTYPLLGSPSIFMLFTLGFVYFICGSLERSWGTKAFGWFWVTMSVVSALSLCAGAYLLKTPLLAAPVLPLASAVVVWGFLNSEEQMSFFFLPLRGIHFVFIAVIYVLFAYAGPGSWGAVPFALVSCLAGFAWLRYGISYRIQSWGAGLIPMSRPVRRAPGVAARPKLKLVPENKPLDDKFSLRDLNPFEWLAKRKRRKQFEKLVGGDD